MGRKNIRGCLSYENEVIGISEKGRKTTPKEERQKKGVANVELESLTVIMAIV